MREPVGWGEKKVVRQKDFSFQSVLMEQLIAQRDKVGKGEKRVKKHDKNSLVETILPVLKSIGFSEASRKATEIELLASLNVLPLGKKPHGTFCLKLHRHRK